MLWLRNHMSDKAIAMCRFYVKCQLWPLATSTQLYGGAAMLETKTARADSEGRTNDLWDVVHEGASLGGHFFQARQSQKGHSPRQM